MTTPLFSVILTLAFFVGLFFLFRSILLWYWRVTDIVEKQDQIISELKALNSISQRQIELLEKIVEEKSTTTKE